jgi:hypothetical protein
LKRNLLAFLLVMNVCSLACTSAVISGKITPDGRPLLWKHRDSDYNENKLMYLHGLKYDFIAVVNSVDTDGEEVWMGSNSKGFSIINTMSYNLTGYETCKAQDDEGRLMKYALGVCSSVEEFEKFLEDKKDKFGVSSNFGVIDANGSAAYFEVDCKSVVKYDVNDPTVAPDGYLIRTNFSCSGKNENGKGYFRYDTAAKIFSEAYKSKNISLSFILDKADRCLQNSVLNNDLYSSELPKDTLDGRFIPFRDYIVRYSTTSSMIIQGVKFGEDPSVTTLWTVLGWPMSTIVTPVWVAAGKELPEITVSNGKETAEINKKALLLKSKCFPINFDNGRDYLNLSYVLNKKGTGVAQKLLPWEKEIVDKTLKLIDDWKATKFNKLEAHQFYKWLNEYVLDIYKTEFGI